MPGQLLGVSVQRQAIVGNRPTPKIWRNGWRNSQKRPGELALVRGIDVPLATSTPRVRSEQIGSGLFRPERPVNDVPESTPGVCSKVQVSSNKSLT